MVFMFNANPFMFFADQNLDEVLALIRFTQSLDIWVWVYRNELALEVFELEHRILHSGEISWCKVL